MGAARFNIPACSLASMAFAPVLAACAAGLGCRAAEPTEAVVEESAMPPEMEMTWEEHPLGGVAAVTARPVSVKEGPAPLVYMTEQGVTVRVVDRGSERTLAEAAVPGRTIVRVDNRTGVVAGRLTLVPGPLPAGRRYAIQVVPQGANVSRTGTMRERVVDEPAEEEVPDRVVDPTGSGGVTQQEPRQ
jgi:hypothetical protein